MNGTEESVTLNGKNFERGAQPPTRDFIAVRPRLLHFAGRGPSCRLSVSSHSDASLVIDVAGS